MRLADVVTPALCVDLDALERNLARMAAYFRDRRCVLRPHFKAHKTPAIAARQAAAGCRGFTCATVREAEVLAAHGHDDLLIANEVVQPAHVAALRSLAARVRVTVAVDSVEGARRLHGIDADALVDVNIGLPRCGAPLDEVAAVARAVAATSLRLRGVMGYEGHAMGIADPQTRAESARAAMTTLLDAADMLRREGVTVDVVSAGGTGTYAISGAIDGITEIQAGSYALMDTAYARYALPFEEALRCLTTVISAHGGLAVVDGGLKALATDHGNPELFPAVDAQVLFLSDEHTTLVLTREGALAVGDRVWLRPSHVDPTVNLHDRLFAFRGDDVVEIWSVDARGYGRE